MVEEKKSATYESQCQMKRNKKYELPYAKYLQNFIKIIHLKQYRGNPNKLSWKYLRHFLGTKDYSINSL